MAQGDPYGQVVQVISINILYFDPGYGADYIYHGKTRCVGLHDQDELQLNDRQQQRFGKHYPHERYPEYYLLKVKQFDDVARDSLDEWIYFLKNGEIRGEFRARGLSKAKEVLDIMNLGDEERRAYEYYLEDLHYQASLYQSSSYVEGKEEGAKAKATEMASTPFHLILRSQRGEKWPDARRASAGIASPLSSSRNNADGCFSPRPEGAPQTRPGGVTALGNRVSYSLRAVPCLGAFGGL